MGSVNDQLAAVTCGVRHQVVVEDSIELGPLGIDTGLDDGQRHLFQLPERLDLHGQLLDGFRGSRARGDQVLEFVDLLLAQFFQVA